MPRIARELGDNLIYHVFNRRPQAKEVQERKKEMDKKVACPVFFSCTRNQSTKAKLIDPVLHDKGWTEDLIHREKVVSLFGVNKEGFLDPNCHSCASRNLWIPTFVGMTDEGRQKKPRHRIYCYLLYLLIILCFFNIREGHYP